MDKLLAPTAYEFDVHQNELTLQSDARLFLLKDINSGKQLLAHLQRNKVSTFVCDMSQMQSLDSNTESLLYQITRYFTDASQKSLLLKAHSESLEQNRLVANLFKLNPNLQFEFISD